MVLSSLSLKSNNKTLPKPNNNNEKTPKNQNPLNLNSSFKIFIPYTWEKKKKKSSIDIALAVGLNPWRGAYLGAIHLTYLYLQVMSTGVHYNYTESKGHDRQY